MKIHSFASWTENIVRANGDFVERFSRRIAFSFDRARREGANEEAMSSLIVEKAPSVTGYCYSKLHAVAVVCSSRVLSVAEYAYCAIHACLFPSCGTVFLLRARLLQIYTFIHAIVSREKKRH